jgi:long-chain fatty acid transport protein
MMNHTQARSGRIHAGAALAALALLSAASPRLLADGTRLPSQDDFVIARGYADVATADRPSAVYYNPAGLAQIGTADFEDGFYVLTPSTSYVGPTGASVSETKQSFLLPYVFMAAPVARLNGEHVTLGFGVYSPFGLSSEWPDDSGFRTLASDNRVRYITSAVSVGVPVFPGFEVGASVEYSKQHVDLNRGLGYVPGDRFHFAGDGSAFSYGIGARWQPVPEHSFGVNFQSKANFGIGGTANLDPLGISFAGHADWVYPEDVSVGYSFRPTPAWNLEFDYDWTNWRRLTTVVLYSPTFTPTPLPFNWQASAYYNLGGTYYWKNGWNLSAGVSYSTNSVPTASFNPSVPDNSRYLDNVGVGYQFGHWEIDSVVQVSPSESRTITGTAPSPAGESANGTYTSSLWAIGFSLRYRY